MLIRSTWMDETDNIDDYADLDPVILASLRTPADEEAIVAAVETQLAARACSVPEPAPVVEFPAAARHRAFLDVEQRAA